MQIFRGLGKHFIDFGTLSGRHQFPKRDLRIEAQQGRETKKGMLLLHVVPYISKGQTPDSCKKHEVGCKGFGGYPGYPPK